MEYKIEKVVKTYYETLEEGKVLGRKCPVCGNVEWPPVYVCNACGSFETEWVQLCGRAQVIEVHTKTAMTAKPAYNDLEPYGYAWVKLEEGPERNVMLRGLTKENAEYVKTHLPYPCHLEIVQRDGYKTCVCAIDPIDADGRLILKATNKGPAPAPKAENNSFCGFEVNENKMEAKVPEVKAEEAPAAEVPAPAETPAASDDHAETLQTIKELIAETYNMDAAALTAESSFQNDINGPSVKFLGVTARLEDIFDIMLSMTEASAAANLGELAKLVDSLKEN